MRLDRNDAILCIVAMLSITAGCGWQDQGLQAVLEPRDVTAGRVNNEAKKQGFQLQTNYVNFREISLPDSAEESTHSGYFRSDFATVEIQHDDIFILPILIYEFGPFTSARILLINNSGEDLAVALDRLSFVPEYSQRTFTRRSFDDDRPSAYLVAAGVEMKDRQFLLLDRGTEKHQVLVNGVNVSFDTSLAMSIGCRSGVRPNEPVRVLEKPAKVIVPDREWVIVTSCYRSKDVKRGKLSFAIYASQSESWFEYEFSLERRKVN